MVTPEKSKEGQDRVSAIRSSWERTGLIDTADMKWILEHANLYWLLARLADDSWVRGQIEIFTLKVELEELKRQLKDKDA